MTQRYMAPPDLESVAVAFHTSVGTMNRDHGVEGGAAVASARTAVVHGSRAPELDAMSREQLYAVVWATPLEQVAERYDISNVALRNRCVRRNIPTPQRGFWQRKAKGYAVSVIALPAEHAVRPH